MFSVQSVTMLYNENWAFQRAVNEQLLFVVHCVDSPLLAAVTCHQWGL
jgi:hypothetical protein